MDFTHNSTRSQNHLGNPPISANQDQFYEQIEGASMGSPSSPILAKYIDGES